MIKLFVFPLSLLLPILSLIAKGEGEVSNHLPKIDFPTQKAIQASIHRGCAFLKNRQNPDGSWGSARQTKGMNIFAPVPGSHRAFRLAVTALSIAALIENNLDSVGRVKVPDCLRSWFDKDYLTA